MVDFLKKEISAQSTTACIYFYFQEGDDALSPERFWVTLIEQLLPQEDSGRIAAALTTKFNASFQRSSPLHPVEYWDLFKAQAQTFKTVYMVLDALDSYLSRDVPNLQSVWDALNKLPPNVKLLFTSRYDSLACNLKADRELRVTPQEADVSAYVKCRIERDTNLNRLLGKPQNKDIVVRSVTTVTSHSGMLG